MRWTNEERRELGRRIDEARRAKLAASGHARIQGDDPVTEEASPGVLPTVTGWLNRSTRPPRNGAAYAAMIAGGSVDQW